MALPRITVLTSGRGSNLAALLAAERHGELDGTIATVIGNRPGLPSLDVATAHGVPAVVVPHASYPEREAFDTALGELCEIVKARREGCAIERARPTNLLRELLEQR